MVILYTSHDKLDNGVPEDPEESDSETLLSSSSQTTGYVGGATQVRESR